VKASLAMLGLCEEVFRSPLAPPTDKTRDELKKTLRELGLSK
jgi:dihydrodipicolinate synthase/N-acetylneuraminate lyase